MTKRSFGSPRALLASLKIRLHTFIKLYKKQMSNGLPFGLPFIHPKCHPFGLTKRQPQKKAGY